MLAYYAPFKARMTNGLTGFHCLASESIVLFSFGLSRSIIAVKPTKKQPAADLTGIRNKEGRYQLD